MTKYIITCCNIFFLFFFLSCRSDSSNAPQSQPQPPKTEDQASEKIAETIIGSAIQKSGMHHLKNASVIFDFRDKHYTCERQNGTYRYERIFTDENGDKILDVLDNKGFVRMINGDTATVDDKKAKAYANSVNSVIYFAFLPYNLNDEAVIPDYLGKISVKGKNYHKIKVTFKKESGGDDFEDVFIYWFNADTYQMDYLAYEYHTDEGGMRFREAFNARQVSAVLIQDYKNYKPKEKGTVKLEDIDKSFESDALVLLSEIVLENVEVEF